MLASAKAQAVYATSDDTSDPCAYEFQLPAMLKVATEDDIEAYYTSLNMNTSKSKDIFPERSLKEQKRLFDREAREQRKKMSRKPRSQLLLGEPREEPKVYLYGEYPLHTMHQDSEPDGLQSSTYLRHPASPRSDVSDDRAGRTTVAQTLRNRSVSLHFTRPSQTLNSNHAAQTDKNPTEDATSDREFPTGDKRKPESGPDSESLILKRARLHHNGEHTSIKHLIYHSHHIADLTPEGQPLPTTPPDAPAPTRIGLTQAPDDDDEDEALPPTFPERSPAQHNPSPSPHQRVERATSSPFDFGPDPDESTLNAISAIEDTLLSGAKRFSNPANLDPAVFDGQDNYRSPSRHSKRSNAKKVRKMADGRLFFAA